MQENQKIYLVNHSCSDVEEYTYLYKLPVLETPFLQDFEPEELPEWEHHLIVDKDGVYSLVTSDDLKKNYGKSRREAVNIAVAKLKSKISYLKTL